LGYETILTGNIRSTHQRMQRAASDTVACRPKNPHVCAGLTGATYGAANIAAYGAACDGDSDGCIASNACGYTHPRAYAHYTARPA